MQSPEHIGFLWSLTKLLTAWLWKEEFSPVSRIVCFCLAVQKAHPGREPHAEHRPKLSTHCRFTNGDHQVDVTSQARAEDKQGLDIYCPCVSLSDFSTLPYAAVSQPEWTQHSLPTVLNREGFWVAVQCFLDQRKKIVRWKLLFSSTGLLFNSASSQGDLGF